MDQNTAQLTVITVNDEVTEDSSKRWFNRSHTPKKHRIQDYVARLERDLATSQRLNETLSANLSAQVEETRLANERLDELMKRVEDLDRRLRVAEEANVVNSRRVSFSFQQRSVDGHADQSTVPISQVELLADESSLVAVASNAATALLDRVVPKTDTNLDWFTATAEVAGELRLVPAFAPMPVELEGEPDDEGEVYNESASSWNARRPASPPSVTWGANPSSRTLLADMSTTGTFHVTPLQQRGTGPTALPGFAV